MNAENDYPNVLVDNDDFGWKVEAWDRDGNWIEADFASFDYKSDAISYARGLEGPISAWSTRRSEFELIRKR